jgi:acyl-coenzyme A thioesterase PaaI-like protein
MGDRLFARGWVVKSGSRLKYCEGEIYTFSDGKPTLIAKAFAIMAVIKDKNKQEAQ